MRIIVKIKYIVSICLNWIQIRKYQTTYQTTPEILIRNSPYKPRHQGVVLGIQNFFKRLRYLCYYGVEEWRIQV